MDILEFDGEYRWLSNFWPAVVVLDGVAYPSVENAYQAAKTYPKNREVFTRCTAGQSKRLWKTFPVRPEWPKIKVAIMRHLISQKFAAGTPLGEKLRKTGDCQIIEGNRWGDVFWGVCGGKGKNTLGKLIMDQRDVLQNKGGPLGIS